MSLKPNFKLKFIFINFLLVRSHSSHSSQSFCLIIFIAIYLIEVFSVETIAAIDEIAVAIGLAILCAIRAAPSVPSVRPIAEVIVASDSGLRSQSIESPHTHSHTPSDSSFAFTTHAIIYLYIRIVCISFLSHKCRKRVFGHKLPNLLIASRTESAVSLGYGWAQVRDSDGTPLTATEMCHIYIVSGVCAQNRAVKHKTNSNFSRFYSE